MSDELPFYRVAITGYVIIQPICGHQDCAEQQGSTITAAALAVAQCNPQAHLGDFKVVDVSLTTHDCQHDGESGEVGEYSV